MSSNEITISYTTNIDYWKDYGNHQLVTEFPSDKLFIDQIMFAPKRGIQISRINTHIVQQMFPDDKGLDRTCNGNFFDDRSNAKLWCCAFKYSLATESCHEFWNKYKDTDAASKFIAIVLGEG